MPIVQKTIVSNWVFHLHNQPSNSDNLRIHTLTLPNIIIENLGHIKMWHYNYKYLQIATILLWVMLLKNKDTHCYVQNNIQVSFFNFV